MRTAWIVAVGLLVSHEVATAKCAQPQLGSEVITPADTKLAADGGVLVGSVSDWERLVGGAEDARNPSWRFSDGTKEYEPALATLAPGLVVYRAPAGVTGALTLVDGKTTRVKVALGTTTVAPLAAPDPKTITLRKVSERYGGFRFELHAALKTEAPAGAVAIVVLGVTKQGKVARSWVRIQPGTKITQVAGSSGRCDPGVPGEIMSKAGDKVVLAWVDAQGRLSKPSHPVVVKNGK